MDSIDYWTERHLLNKQANIQRSIKYEKKAIRQLNHALDDVQSDINGWLRKYAKEDGMTLNDATKLLRGSELEGWHQTLDEWELMAKSGGFEHEMNLEYYRSRISRLSALEAQLKMTLAKYSKNESSELNELLTKEYKDNYYQTTYLNLAQRGKLNANFSKYSGEQFNSFVKQRWHGHSFSERVWGNFTRDLPKELVAIIRRGITLGYSTDRLVKTAGREFKQFNKYKQHRLILTEMAHVANEANMKSYENDGISRYKYLATLEARTCQDCGRLDGNIFNLSDKITGLNFPTIHPHCRCTTVPVIDDAQTSQVRFSRNPHSNKPEYVGMNYAEWSNEVGLN